MSLPTREGVMEELGIQDREPEVLSSGFTTIQEKDIITWYTKGESVSTIRKHYHCTPERIKSVLVKAGIELRSIGEAARLRAQNQPDQQVDYLPTPEEIAAMALKIRKKNEQAMRESPATHYKTVPGIKVCKQSLSGRRVVKQGSR